MGVNLGIVVIVLGMFLAFAFLTLYKKHLSPHIKNHAKIFTRIIYALSFLIIAFSLYVGINIMDLPPNVSTFFSTFDASILVKLTILLITLYLLFLLTNYFTDNLIHIWGKGSRSKILFATVLNYLLKVFLFFFILYVALKLLSLDMIHFAKALYELVNSVPYAYSLSIFVIYLLVAKFVLLLFKTYFAAVVRHTRTKMDDIIVSGIDYPLTWIIVLIGVILALSSISSHMQYLNYMLPVIKSIIVVIAIHTLIKLTNDLLEEWWEEQLEKIDEDIIQITSNFLKILFILIGIIAILVIWGADIKSLLVGVGIISLVLGIALRDSIDNMFSGVSMMLDNTFRVGDVIQLESKEKGKVTHIGLRCTHIRINNSKKEQLIVPNSVLARMRIINHSRRK
jgi:small-conductance mechanosensitive channel